MLNLLLIIARNRHRRRSLQQYGFYNSLTLYGHRRRDRRIRRRGLLSPSMSSWSILFGSGCEQSLITFTGLDHRFFRKMVLEASTGLL